MKQASFSIKNYYFDKVFIDMENSTTDKLYVDFKPSGQFIEKEKIFKLSFIFLAYTSEEQGTKPFIEVRCIGEFSFKNVNTLKDVPDFFYRNSIAILFPYLRAYISMVTNQANVRSVMLPTMNLMSIEKPLRDNTSTI